MTSSLKEAGQFFEFRSSYKSFPPKPIPNWQLKTKLKRATKRMLDYSFNERMKAINVIHQGYVGMILVKTEIDAKTWFNSEGNANSGFHLT